MGLLAHELGDADRRRGLGGEGRQQAAVVGGVVLLGQPRAEVERADQLALRDERDDERDTGLAEGADRRRVELEAGDLDRSGRGLEVGEQRVGLGDVDRDREARTRVGSASGRRAPRPASRVGHGAAGWPPRPRRRRIGRVSSLISGLMLRGRASGNCYEMFGGPRRS